MELEFLKMQVAGRDVVVVDAGRNTRLSPEDLPELSRRALDRRRGIGGDALLLLSRSPESELAVRAFSTSGAEEEPTLSSLICAGRYAIDSGLVTRTSIRAVGPERAVVLDALDSRSILADIGAPRRDDGDGELVEDPELAYSRTVTVGERDFTFTPLRIGPLQAVSFISSFDIDIRRLSLGFRAAFPAAAGDPEAPIADPTELSYARVTSRSRLYARTWRYGRGEVRSEGYAAAAAAVAATLHGFADRDTIVASRGGELYVSWSERNNRLYVTGTPEYVFTGTYDALERHDGGQAVR